MAFPQKATDEQIVDAYQRTRSVWKAADELGMCGQSVHKRLQKLGIDTSANLFTKEDERYLAERYVVYRDAGQLQVLADEMGRTKAFICRQAGKMGLTDPNRKQPMRAKVWDTAPDAVLIPIWDKFKRSRKTMSAYCRANHYNVQSFVDAMRRAFPDEYDAVIASKKPKRTQYAVGRDFEYYVRDKFTDAGYLALRSPASKSPADLYCIKTGEVVFVQCKLHGVIPPDEWNEFLDYSESVGATPIVAMRGPRDRGAVYMMVTGRKSGSRGQKQPWEPWELRGGKGDGRACSDKHGAGA